MSMFCTSAVTPPLRTAIFVVSLSKSCGTWFARCDDAKSYTGHLRTISDNIHSSYSPHVQGIWTRVLPCFQRVHLLNNTIEPWVRNYFSIFMVNNVGDAQQPI